MSRFIQGNCIQIMSGFPDKAVDFILTDPPYLVGFRDRAGRTIAGDQTDEWLQPASHEMYRVLKTIHSWSAFTAGTGQTGLLAPGLPPAFALSGISFSQRPTRQNPLM